MNSNECACKESMRGGYANSEMLFNEIIGNQRKVPYYPLCLTYFEMFSVTKHSNSIWMRELLRQERAKDVKIRRQPKVKNCFYYEMDFSLVPSSALFFYCALVPV